MCHRRFFRAFGVLLAATVVAAIASPATAEVRIFKVTGQPTGTPWDWELQGSLNCEATGLTTSPGGGCPAIVNQWVASINTFCGPNTARAQNGCRFSIRSLLDDTFNLTVNSSGDTPCAVTVANPNGCQFNPTAFEDLGVPGVSDWGLMLLIVLILGAGTAVLVRRLGNRQAES